MRSKFQGKTNKILLLLTFSNWQYNFVNTLYPKEVEGECVTRTRYPWLVDSWHTAHHSWLSYITLFVCLICPIWQQRRNRFSIKCKEINQNYIHHQLQAKKQFNSISKDVLFDFLRLFHPCSVRAWLNLLLPLIPSSPPNFQSLLFEDVSFNRNAHSQTHALASGASFTTWALFTRRRRRHLVFYLLCTHGRRLARTILILLQIIFLLLSRTAYTSSSRPLMR